MTAQHAIHIQPAPVTIAPVALNVVPAPANTSHAAGGLAGRVTLPPNPNAEIATIIRNARCRFIALGATCITISAGLLFAGPILASESSQERAGLWMMLYIPGSMFLLMGIKCIRIARAMNVIAPQPNAVPREISESYESSESSGLF